MLSGNKSVPKPMLTQIYMLRYAVNQCWSSSASAYDVIEVIELIVFCYMVRYHWFCLYSSGFLHMISPVPMKSPWRTGVYESLQSLGTDNITTIKLNTTKLDEHFRYFMENTAKPINFCTAIGKFMRVTWALWRLISPATQLFVQRLI